MANFKATEIRCSKDPLAQPYKEELHVSSPHFFEVPGLFADDVKAVVGFIFPWHFSIKLTSILKELISKVDFQNEISMLVTTIKSKFMFSTYHHFRYVFWYHGERMINYDKSDRVSVQTRSSKDKKQTNSTLVIRNADPSQSGNYTCQPSNAIGASIQVFVSEGASTIELHNRRPFCGLFGTKLWCFLFHITSVQAWNWVFSSKQRLLHQRVKNRKTQWAWAWQKRIICSHRLETMGCKLQCPSVSLSPSYSSLI